MDFEIVGTQSHPFRAVETHGAQVGGIQIVFFDRSNLCCVEGVLIPGNIHTQDMGRLKQTPGMILQAENGGAFICMVGAHAFEHTHTIMHGVRQHMHLGIAPGYHLTVHPDQTVSIRHRLHINLHS